MIYPIDNIKINENLNDAQKSILKNFFEESISCIILGDSSTGKSSFLVHYFQNEDDIFKTTLGIDKEVKIKNPSNPLELMEAVLLRYDKK